MKTIIHKANTRGFADHGWLKTYHTFSFANYYDPQRTHFGLLRVLNDDTVGPGMGFGTHPHDNMEIITIPLSGSLEHKDSMGTGSVIKPNEVQIMSAGTGITHSEFNHSSSELVKLLQIWVFPKQKNIKPRYDQQIFLPSNGLNKFQLIVSPDKSDNSMLINQDAWFSLGHFDKDQKLEYAMNKKEHGAYIFVIEGKAEIAGEHLEKRDGIGIYDTDSFFINVNDTAYILIMEVPMR